MNEPRERRVVVALDPGAPQETALQAVASVVGGAAGAEVLGLFVEDVALLSLARLSVVREVTIEACERALSAEQVERQFRAQATRLRSLFEVSASRAGFRHRFRVARGDVHREILKAAAGCDVLVLAHSRARAAQTVAARLHVADLPPQGPQTLVFVQERWPTGRRVVTLYRGPEDDAALELAAAVARTEGLELAVLELREAASPSELRAALEGLGCGNLVRCRRLAGADVAALARAAAIEDARAFVLSGAFVDKAQGLVAELLKRVECSVIVARAGGAP